MITSLISMSQWKQVWSATYISYHWKPHENMSPTWEVVKCHLPFRSCVSTILLTIYQGRLLQFSSCVWKLGGFIQAMTWLPIEFPICVPIFLVGGWAWPTPLKDDGVKVSWDDESFPTERKVRKHVPNHQPVMMNMDETSRTYWWIILLNCDIYEIYWWISTILVIGYFDSGKWIVIHKIFPWNYWNSSAYEIDMNMGILVGYWWILMDINRI
jgi:hypothetical protein